MIEEIVKCRITCDMCQTVKPEEFEGRSSAELEAKKDGWCCDPSRALWACPKCKELIPNK